MTYPDAQNYPDPEDGMSWHEIAASAYRAYAASTGNKNYQGNPMPPWEELPRRIQIAWEAAARQTAWCIGRKADAPRDESIWNGWLPPESEETP